MSHLILKYTICKKKKKKKMFWSAGLNRLRSFTYLQSDQGLPKLIHSTVPNDYVGSSEDAGQTAQMHRQVRTFAN